MCLSKQGVQVTCQRAVMSGKPRDENAPASALTFRSLSGTTTMEKALDAPTAGMIVNSSELRAAGL